MFKPDQLTTIDKSYALEKYNFVITIEEIK